VTLYPGVSVPDLPPERTLLGGATFGLSTPGAAYVLRELDPLPSTAFGPNSTTSWLLAVYDVPSSTGTAFCTLRMAQVVITNVNALLLTRISHGQSKQLDLPTPSDCPSLLPAPPSDPIYDDVRLRAYWESAVNAQVSFSDITADVGAVNITIGYFGPPL